MTLNLDLEFTIGSARGRQAKPLGMEFVRELEDGDKPLILAPPPLGDKPPTIAKLRHTHHQLAKQLAMGKPAVEAGLMTGYSSSRISILQNDPAFMELIEYYKANIEAKFAEFHERLAALGQHAVDELQDRLEDGTEKFSKKELMELMKLCAENRAPGGNKFPVGGGGPPMVKIVFESGPQNITPLLTDVTHSASDDL